jgi:glycosyltransferase involved in cell wall biosynthesis
LPADGVDLIYANTVATLGALSTLAARHHVPAICHVHELEMGIRSNCGVDAFRRAQRDVDTYIVASRAVADNLRTTHCVEPERIRQVYEAIPIGERDRAATAALGARTRRELDIPHDAFVVGGCGTMDWRKAPEVFLQIAARVARGDLGRAVHFVWIGGTSSGAPLDGLLYDARRLGLDAIAHFVGPQREPARYFAMFDAFLLSSREDPFPLVCLEAATLEVPTVCFADAGGMAELIEEDAGFVVPYLDIERAAECLVAMGRSEALRVGLGARAAEKVRAAHDIEVVGRQIASLLDAHLQRPALRMG